MSYIDESKPKKSIKIERFVFDIEIVCAQGKLMRTEGRERLIYPNEEHQRLKRTFKIYNQLNNSIISILKKKSGYPLRVPFCCLIEYKGYTALAQILPVRQSPSSHKHLLKPLGPDFPACNYRLTDFEENKEKYCLLSVATAYKSTKSDMVSLLKVPNMPLCFLELNRRAGISI